MKLKRVVEGKLQMIFVIYVRRVTIFKPKPNTMEIQAQWVQYNKFTKNEWKN